MTSPHYLSQLSELQTKAVTSSAKHLQILAGPGSGKTKALTTRVTWLIKENNMDPSSILVVTFTNKAANEMKERLERPSMVGREQSRLLSMGTFHSLCARMLRLHVDLTLLKPNFVITDANKSIQLVKMVLKELQPTLSSSTQKKSQDIFYDNISKAKNQGLDHITYMARFENDPVKKDIALVYRAYEEKLETGNMIDFDGLLLHGRNLLKDYPEVVDHIEHVLVDEFQDTNELQYELIRLLTHRGDKSLTVVGDPDQSIFGWRFANKSHFGKMVSDYKDTIVVNLEESYRSTKNIIACATHVVNKDTKRESRNLYTSNPDGSLVSVLKVNSEKHETELVAKEIKRIVEFSNGLINYKDIAILFRMNFMTLNFERALSRANIPHIVVSGSRFLDLMEVKDVLAYLHLFYNHRDLASFTRIINTPKRGLGEISIKKIQVMAATQDWTLLETMHNIVDQHPSTCSMRIMSKAKLEMANLLTLQKKVQDMMNEKVQTDNILKCIVDSIGYRDYLQTNYAADYETKWANVDELFTFAKRQDSQSYQGESGIEAVELFLESTTLCGDAKEHDEAQEGCVSLITMHAAKGLEWACVFIVGCEEGLIPMPRATDLVEESRVFYVAMTRAKCFLYCTHSAQRSRWGKVDATVITRFLYDLPTAHYRKQTPAWNAQLRKWVAQVLRKPYIEDEQLLLEDDGRAYDSNDDKIFANIVDKITMDLRKTQLY